MDDKDKIQKASAELLWPQVGTVVRHYKGGLYVVMCRSVKEDTIEPLVTYRSVAKGTYWTRTLLNFSEPVQVDGKNVPRFSTVQE